MIIVKIELHSARTGKITELGRAHISNTGTSDNPKRGDYNIEIFRKGSTTKVQRRGLVRDYPRLSYTVWELVRRSLESALGKWPIHPGHPEEFDEEVNELEEVMSTNDKNSYQWLSRFRTWLYQNNRSAALDAEEALLKENNPTTPTVCYGVKQPYYGFTLGKEIQPSVVSEEFQRRINTLKGK